MNTTINVSDCEKCGENWPLLNNVHSYTANANIDPDYGENYQTELNAVLHRAGYVADCNQTVCDPNNYIKVGLAKDLTPNSKLLNRVGCSIPADLHGKLGYMNFPICQRDWDTLYADDEQAKTCCATGNDGAGPDSLAWKSGHPRMNCHPNFCPASNDCFLRMNRLCNQKWDSRCDSYLTTAPSDYAKVLVGNRLQTYLDKNGIDSTGGTSTEWPAILGLCERYPGVCDNILDARCKDVKRADLLKNADSLLPKICGCHMRASEYADYSALSSDGKWTCDPACTSGAIKRTKSDGSGFEQCTNTNCIIKDVLINQLEGDGAELNVSQICDSCGDDSVCVCHFSDIGVDDVNKKLANGMNLKQKCNVCVIDDKKDPFNPLIVDCGTTNPVSPPGRKPDVPKTPSTIPAYVWGIGGIALVAIIAIIIAIIIFKIKKK